MHFKKIIFDLFFRFYGLTSYAIFSVIWPCRIVCNTILENYKEKSFQKWFWNLSYVFGSGHKMHLKKNNFWRFLAQLLYVIFSVICLCRKLFNTILWGDGGPKGQVVKKRFLKKAIFFQFLALFRTHFKWNFLSHLTMYNHF